VPARGDRRRLARADREPLPDLLLIDGGKGQLAVVSARSPMRASRAHAASIAKEKDEESPSLRVEASGGLKAERVFLPNRKDAIVLPPSSRALLLLQRVRDESHRFAIEFQRKLRSKQNFASILEELPGIGPGKRRALLASLGSLRGVRDASIDALEAVPGISRRDAQTIAGFFAAIEK
jgi:excinuclease ABC subunit C